MVQQLDAYDLTRRFELGGREVVTLIALARPPMSGITSFSKIRSINSALY
jgi:hypothetical protein